MLAWLPILPILIGLIPGLSKPGDTSQADKLIALITELIGAGGALMAGWVPPRDVPSILADIDLLLASIPADLASQIPALATVQADVAKFTAYLTDLNQGDEIVLPGSWSIPGVTNKVRACLFTVPGHFATDNLGL